MWTMRFTAPSIHSDPTQLHFSPGSTFLLAYESSSGLQVRAADSLNLIRQWCLTKDDSQAGGTGSPSLPFSGQSDWSPDGQYIFASTSSSRAGPSSAAAASAANPSTIQVFIVDPRKQPSTKLFDSEGKDVPGVSPEAVAVIQTGAVGLRRAEWGPAGAPASVFAFATDELGLTIHVLVDGSKAVIQDVNKAKYFPHPTDHRCFAVLRRNHTTSIETISIYRYIDKATAEPTTYMELLSSHRKQSNLASNWTLESSFATSTNDAANVSWSPDGSLLAVWEGQMEYKLHLFTTMGYRRGTFSVPADANRSERGPTFQQPVSHATSTSIAAGPEAGGGVDVAALMASDERALAHVAGGGLGIRCCQWQPVRRDAPIGVGLLAIGGYDEQVWFLSPFTDHPMAQGWGLLGSGGDTPTRSSLDLSKKTISVGPATTVFRQQAKSNDDDVSHFDAVTSMSASSIAIPAMRPDWEKVNPKVGISYLQWDPSGEWLAVRNESMPSILCIYHLPSSVDAQGEFKPPTHLPTLHSIVFFSSALVDCVWRPTAQDRHQHGHRAPGQMAVITAGQPPAVCVWQIDADDGQAGVKRIKIPLAARSGVATTIKYSNDGRNLLIAWRETGHVGETVGRYCVGLQDDDDDDECK